MPRAATPLRDGETIPKEFDLRFRGLDLLPRRGRQRDRFRIRHHASTVQQYNQRLAFVLGLHGDAKDDVLRALNDGLCTLPELEHAYSKGARAVALLLERRRTDEDEAKAEAERERRNPRLAPLVRAYEAQWHGRDRARLSEVLARLLAYLGGDSARVADLTAPKIKGYLGSLTVVREDWKKRAPGTALAPATINRHRSVVQGLCSSLKADGVLAVHPFADGAVPLIDVGDATPQPMSPAEIRDYLAAVRATWMDAELPLWLLLHTGIDVGELKALRMIDVLDNGGPILWIRSTRGKTGTRTKAASRKIPVTIPALLDGLRSRIRLYGMQGEDVVFQDLSRWKLSQTHIAAVASIKRPSITVKGLRHVAAIYWRKAGADLQTIQKWLGHASITSTVIYTEFGEDAEWETPLAVKAGLLQASLIPVVVPDSLATPDATEGNP